MTTLFIIIAIVFVVMTVVMTMLIKRIDRAERTLEALIEGRIYFELKKMGEENEQSNN